MKYVVRADNFKKIMLRLSGKNEVNTEVLSLGSGI